MRQTSGIAFFRTFSETLARAFRWQRTGSTRAVPNATLERDSKAVAVVSAPRAWLNELSWQKVLEFNSAQCQLQNTQPTPNRASYEAVRHLWEVSLGQPMSLIKALDLCKLCHDRLPFVFSNTSTFCQVARTMVEALAKDLPPVEGHIIRNTAANYVTGRIARRELIEILRTYESKWALLARVSSNGHVEERPNG